jgi:serine/threonine protein phosphatase PrpC
MTVVCAACGKLSRDPEFCDHCNADLQRGKDRLAPPRCPLPGGDIDLSPVQRQALGRVEDAVTVEVASGRWRVHWVPAAEVAAWHPLLEDRQTLDLDCLPACHRVEAAFGQWVISPAAPAAGYPWHDRTAYTDPLDRLRALIADVGSLAHTVEQLHRHGRVWLTFDPAAVEDVGPLSPRAAPDAEALGLRRLRITNLDLRLFRRGECPESLGLHAKYAAPEVCALRTAEIGPATDVYHLALFAYYWCAGLLPEGFVGAGLEAFEHRLPPLRTFRADLPEGVVPAIMNGLAVEPGQRYARPGELVAALRERLAEALARRRPAGPIAWDAAALSETGRSKAALGKDNEDHFLLRAYPESAAVLAAVADGISTCDIGSGALASLIATIMLENRFDASCSHADFPRRVAEACREGSQQLLDWAMEKGYGDQLALGLDLMGTTLTVGWLQGRELSLANLGDSRAYLITPRWWDLLTVDGDLGTELLARGAPPEQVLRMGVVARALRGCVGGCTINDGRVEVLAEGCQPSLSRWPVVPGDVIVLCTDGVVEEGYFLEPEAMAEMVQAHHAQPAAELARRLVEAADAVQRLPSAAEPEGFGDNITCIVFKITACVSRMVHDLLSGGR